MNDFKTDKTKKISNSWTQNIWNTSRLTAVLRCTQCGKKTKDEKKAQNFFRCPYFRLPEGAILKLKLLVIENLSF